MLQGYMLKGRRETLCPGDTQREAHFWEHKVVTTEKRSRLHTCCLCPELTLSRHIQEASPSFQSTGTVQREPCYLDGSEMKPLTPRPEPPWSASSLT